LRERNGERETKRNIDKERERETEMGRDKERDNVLI
jgi:hypothetical protein